MSELREPAVGETWAYRSRRKDPLVQVVVARLGTKTPRRVQIRFVEEEFEGASGLGPAGTWHRRRGAPDDHISPEICASVDEEHGRPLRALLREWCGANAVDLRAEISSLREEAARAAELAQAAVELLRRHGHPRDANRLERELADLRRG